MEHDATRRLAETLARTAAALDDDTSRQAGQPEASYTGDQVVRLLRVIAERVITECRLCVVDAYELGFRQGMAPDRPGTAAPRRRPACHLHLVRDGEDPEGAR